MLISAGAFFEASLHSCASVQPHAPLCISSTSLQGIRWTAPTDVIDVTTSVEQYPLSNAVCYTYLSVISESSVCPDHPIVLSILSVSVLLVSHLISSIYRWVGCSIEYEAERQNVLCEAKRLRFEGFLDLPQKNENGDYS